MDLAFLKQLHLILNSSSDDNNDIPPHDVEDDLSADIDDMSSDDNDIVCEFSIAKFFLNNFLEPYFRETNPPPVDGEAIAKTLSTFFKIRKRVLPTDGCTAIDAVFVALATEGYIHDLKLNPNQKIAAAALKEVFQQGDEKGINKEINFYGFALLGEVEAIASKLDVDEATEGSPYKTPAMWDLAFSLAIDGCFGKKVMRLLNDSHADLAALEPHHESILRMIQAGSNWPAGFVQCLFDKKALDVNKRYEEGSWTIMHWAVEYASPDFLEQLIAISNIKKDLLECRVNLWKVTPLHLAVSRGCIEQVRILLDAGALVQAVTDYNSTVLHLASYPEDKNHAYAIMNLLLDHERTKDLALFFDKQDNEGMTPLVKAFNSGFRDVAYLLLRAMKQVDPALMLGGLSLKEVAVQRGWDDIKLLLEAKNRVDVVLASLPQPNNAASNTTVSSALVTSVAAFSNAGASFSGARNESGSTVKKDRNDHQCFF